ncbi:MAG TPA: GerMN domain-containing protein [Rectinemataceae bacterium]|nr:GerMN domain-containing protein [Rectinemataceae bacterium]
MWLYILSAITVLALVANGLNPASRHARLYFLDARGTKLVAETRDLSLVGSLEQRSQKVLQELMLGPFSYELQPLFRQDVRLVGVMHRGNKLTVELTIPDLAGLDVSFKLIRAAFEKSLAESVPGAGELDLYVNGALALR